MSNVLMPDIVGQCPAALAWAGPPVATSEIGVYVNTVCSGFAVNIVLLVEPKLCLVQYSYLRVATGQIGALSEMLSWDRGPFSFH